MKLFWNITLAIFSCCLISSCDIINPEEAIPAYVSIAPFTISTSPITEGSSSEKITDAWVSINGEFLGVYDLPATVPVLNFGTTIVKVEAGIRDNGVSATPDIYPFYEPFSVSVDLVAGETVSLEPTTSYLSTTKFAFIEDFENSRPRLFTQEILGLVGISQTDEDVFEGGFSGTFGLSRENRPVVELSTLLQFSGLQEDGVFVYLEVNYKSDAPVLWGIVGEEDPVAGLEKYFDPGFAPKAEWNKIYFNLSQLIFDSRLDEFQIGMQSFLRLEDPDTANVYLDNIKLVHF